jgi:hypothetical protein
MTRQSRHFWAIVAFNMTVAARETYEPQTEGVVSPAKLRSFNEMLHRICSCLAAENNGSDSWLFAYLHDESKRSGTATAVEWALADAKKKVLGESSI